jgi:hypothetical protein
MSKEHILVSLFSSMVFSSVTRWSCVHYMCMVDLGNVMMREHCTFGSQIFGCGKVYYSISVIITNFVQTVILNCWFEYVFPTFFGIKEPG